MATQNLRVVRTPALAGIKAEKLPESKSELAGILKSEYWLYFLKKFAQMLIFIKDMFLAPRNLTSNNDE